MAQSTYAEIVGISSLECSPKLGMAGVMAPCFILWRILQSSMGWCHAVCIESLPSLSTKSLCPRKSRITSFKMDAASHGFVLLVAATSRNLLKNANVTINTCRQCKQYFYRWVCVSSNGPVLDLCVSRHVTVLLRPFFFLNTGLFKAEDDECEETCRQPDSFLAQRGVLHLHVFTLCLAPTLWQ